MHETKAGQFDPAATFTKLCDSLRTAADASAILGHYHKANGDETIGQGFLAISELLLLAVDRVTRLAMRRLL